MLDMISSALDSYLSARNFSTVRIDGHCTLQQRHDALDQFNNDPNCIIILATIGAMGEGYVSPSASLLSASLLSASPLSASALKRIEHNALWCFVFSC